MKQRKKFRWIFVVFSLLLMISGCTSKGETELALEQAEVSPTIEEDSDFEEQETKEIKTQIYIDVEGLVKNPGVYILEEKARVFQAIEAAGGLCDNAYTKELNQARILEDGEKITIYSKEEWQEEKQAEAAVQNQTETDETDTRVNINTADKETLMTITGIGETRADAILAYRNNYGSFQKIEDIMQVDGIKEGTFLKIKDKIVVK